MYENPKFEQLLGSLAEHSADFVVIGGLAVAIHGGDTATFDVDVAFARGQQNARAIAQALAPFHPRPADWPQDLPFVWDEQTIANSSAMTLDTELGRIDLISEPPGAPDFESLRKAAEEVEIKDSLAIPVASIHDLIAMKLAMNRPKDQIHVATLRRLLELGEE